MGVFFLGGGKSIQDCIDPQVILVEIWISTLKNCSDLAKLSEPFVVWKSVLALNLSAPFFCACR